MPANGHFNRTQHARNAAFGEQLSVVLNAMTLGRQALRDTLVDPRRNIARECGHPDTIRLQDYQDQYDRNPFAVRVTHFWPDEAWKESPEIIEVESGDTVTAFEQSVSDLGRQLMGEQNWYQDEEGSVFWSCLHEADQKAGIGRYGALFLGLDDGLDLIQPVPGFEEKNSLPTDPDRPKGYFPGPYSFSLNTARTKGRKALFLRPLSELQATVTKWEANWSSPRHGQPVEYQLTLGDPNRQGEGARMPAESKRVHWSRVVHIDPERCVPRMQECFDNLLDIKKILGSSAEGYWQSCFATWAIETDPSLGGDVDVDTPGIRDHMEQVRQGMQRDVMLNGATIKTLAPQVVDPKPGLDSQILALCVKLDVAVRVFMGSERGELASSQDQKLVDGRAVRRRVRVCSPRVIQPVVNRLIAVGALAPPARGYSAKWPSVESMTKEERARVLLTRTQSYGEYVTKDVRSLVAPLDYLTREAGMTDEEAQTIMANAENDRQARQAEEAKRQQAAQDAALAQMAPPNQPAPNVVGGGV